MIVNDVEGLELIANSVVYVRGWLTPAETCEFAPRIIDETYPHWQQQMSYMKGWPARVDKGHHMARFGDPGVTYDYKGKAKPVHPVTCTLDVIRKMVERSIGWYPNCVVLNSYEPSSGLYPHVDGRFIPQLGPTPTIVSVTFGATRTFQLHKIDKRTQKRDRGVDPINVPLSDGDMLIMHGTCDQDYMHGIPVEPGAPGTRISLTFRKHF